MFAFLSDLPGSFKRAAGSLFGGDRQAPKPSPPPAPAPPPIEAAPEQAKVDPQKVNRAASQLFDAMDGFGTDEDAIHTALRGKSPAEVAEIRRVYKEHYGRSLDGDLATELSGTELAAAQAALSGDKVKAAAAALVNAADGLGTDEETIRKTLRELTDPEERRRVDEEVRRRTGRSLGELLDDELSGSAGEQAKLLAQGRAAEADAARLDEAMHGGLFGLGTDEDAIHETLSGGDRGAVADAYVKRTGHTLKEDLRSELSGADLDLATSLASGDEAAAGAARLELAMSGLGTDEEAIFRELQGNPQRAATIAAYNRRYGAVGGGADFDDAVRDELGGLDQERARQLEKDGRLDPVLAIRCAVDGTGTDEEMIRSALRGLSPAAAADVQARYQATYGVDLREELTSELSGRDEHAIGQMVAGEPQTAKERLERARSDHDFERGSGAGVLGGVTDLFSDSGVMLDRQHERLEQLEAALSDARTDEQRAAVEAQIETVAGYQSSDVESFHKAQDKVASTAATAAAVAATVVATIATGGVAAAPMMTALSSSLGVSTAAAGAAVGALSGGAATMLTKAAILGDAYGVEAAGTDAAMTLVQAATGGVMASEWMKGVTSGIQGSMSELGAQLTQGSIGAGLLGSGTAQNIVAQTVTNTGQGAVSGLAGGLLDENVWRGEGSGLSALLGHIGQGALGNTFQGIGQGASAGFGKASMGTLTGGLADGWDPRLGAGLRGFLDNAAGGVVTAAVNPLTYEGRWEDIALRVGQNVGTSAIQGGLMAAAGAHNQMKFEERQAALADPVKAIHLALQGIGTDEDLLRQALKGKTAAESEQIRARYREVYGTDLDSDLAGELSGRAGREIRLMLPKEPGPMFGSAEFDSAMDKATGSTSKGGNQVTPLFDGVSSFAERAKMIDAASGSIDLQTFIFNDDDTGWQLALQLAQKAQEGVKVRVIYDAVGSGRASPELFAFMEKAGVEVRAAHLIVSDPLSANNSWHEKHLIVDGKQSIEGGMNIADEYALGGTDQPVTGRGDSPGWRDVDVKLVGPAVADAEQAFLKNWQTLGDPAEASAPRTEGDAAGAAHVRVVQHRPNQEGDDHVEQLYLQSIRSARKSITIENAYFLPSEELRMELMAAAQRGVQVNVLTNSRETNDVHAVADASRHFFDELVAAGVNIREKDGNTLHAKTAAFDGAYSIVGSANLNGRSQGLDSEVVLGIADAAVAAQLQARYAEGLDGSHGVTRQGLAEDSALTKARQWVMSGLRWTF